ncbi:hypothetical protein SKAU_G00334660 [Synaphobranchus kaupii]|uniref:Uncharacterized protein n=1 Tax=Synaphobranchus kaupii TaxID=118154 RepID=A0A9Q1IHX6_SYNKA|nr:hypothetical protein SKAU_G00334660 [Synaphobranchus kaupii]
MFGGRGTKDTMDCLKDTLESQIHQSDRKLAGGDLVTLMMRLRVKELLRAVMDWVPHPAEMYFIDCECTFTASTNPLREGTSSGHGRAGGGRLAGKMWPSCRYTERKMGGCVRTSGESQRCERKLWGGVVIKPEGPGFRLSRNRLPSASPARQLPLILRNLG